MRVQLSRPARRRESGAVAILVAAFATLVFVLAAFVVDYGVAYTNKRHLQAGADASVLAGAHTIQSAAAVTDTCAVIAGGTVGSQAQSAALDNLSLNGATGDAAAGHSATVTCVDDRPLVETVTGRHKATTFAGMFGVQKVPVGAVARATVGVAGSAVGVRPFGICVDIANKLRDQPTVNHTVPINNGDLGCGHASGNWAMMDMNGGGNSSAEAQGWISNGYSDPVEIDTSGGTIINGDTGTPSPGGYAAAMDSILDEESLLPVYSQILSPNGNNADFVITGFVGVRLCGWKFNGQSGSVPCFDSSGPLPKSYIQVRFARMLAVGELSSWCRLGDPSCDRGVRVVKMVG